MPTIGTAQCIICHRDIPIKENEKGTRSHSCGYCDVTIYSKKNTESYRLLSKIVKLSPVDDVDVDREPAKSPSSSAPAPAARTAPPASSSAAKMPWMR